MGIHRLRTAALKEANAITLNLWLLQHPVWVRLPQTVTTLTKGIRDKVQSNPEQSPVQNSHDGIHLQRTQGHSRDTLPPVKGSRPARASCETEKSLRLKEGNGFPFLARYSCQAASKSLKNHSFAQISSPNLHVGDECLADYLNPAEWTKLSWGQLGDWDPYQELTQSRAKKESVGSGLKSYMH